jgi:glycosyltransferase involved in cell wall biosynthesis/GR25 family glycosyltransferase involved in LPS biosynthesis
MSLLNKLVDNVYILNLERRKDRMYKINYLMNKYNIIYQRVNAIDGKDKHVINDYNELKNKKHTLITNSFAYGNILSFINILKDAINKKYNKILIFEDDIICHNNFNNILNKINNIPDDWKILYLGSSQRIGTINKIKKYNNYYIANESRGTFAFIIDSSIFKEVLLLWEKKDMNVDMSLSIIQNKYICYVMWENLIISDLINSDIHKDRNLISYSSKFGWDLNSYTLIKFPINTDFNTNIYPTPNLDIQINNNISYTVLVSIILPVYNGSNYLDQCIKSIVNSAFYNYELIIINDGSYDNTELIIKENIKNMKNKVILINNIKNKGIVYSLNKGLTLSNGKYITWISHDNLFQKKALLKMSNYLEINKTINLVISGHQNIGKRTNSILPFEYTHKDIIYNFHGIACFMFRKSITNKIGLYDEKIKGVEDWDYLIRILEIEPFKCGTINEILYNYRRHEEQLSNNINIHNAEILLFEKIIIHNPVILNYNEYDYNKYLKYNKRLSIIQSFDVLKKIPKTIFTYWYGPLSYLNYLSIKSFFIASGNDARWTINIYVPKYPGTLKPSWDSGENTFKYEGLDYFNKLKELNVLFIEIDFNEIGFINNCNEILKSDYLRLYILSTKGGIWCDADIIFIKPIMSNKYNYNYKKYILNNYFIDVFISYSKHYSIGFLMASPNNPFFNELLNNVKVLFDKTNYQSIGNLIYKKIHPTCDNIHNKYPQLSIANFEYELVYPFKWNETSLIFKENVSINLNNIIGIHWFNGSNDAKEFINNNNYEKNVTINNIIKNFCNN